MIAASPAVAIIMVTEEIEPRLPWLGLCARGQPAVVAPSEDSRAPSPPLSSLFSVTGTGSGGKLRNDGARPRTRHFGSFLEARLLVFGRTRPALGARFPRFWWFLHRRIEQRESSLVKILPLRVVRGKRGSSYVPKRTDRWFLSSPHESCLPGVMGRSDPLLIVCNELS